MLVKGTTCILQQRKQSQTVCIFFVVYIIWTLRHTSIIDDIYNEIWTKYHKMQGKVLDISSWNIMASRVCGSNIKYRWNLNIFTVLVPELNDTEIPQ